jgi:hypothetical protein
LVDYGLILIRVQYLGHRLTNKVKKPVDHDPHIVAPPMYPAGGAPNRLLPETRPVIGFGVLCLKEQAARNGASRQPGFER